MVAFAEETEVIEGDVKTMGEVVSTTLNRLGWHVKFANVKMRQISATSEVSRRRGRDLWRYSFDARIRWHKEGAKVRLEVNVTEKEMGWTSDDCARHCTEIIKGIEADAATLAESELENDPSDAYGSARWATDVASLIIKNTSSPFTKDAKVWEDSESQLLISLILYAVGEGKDLGSVRRLLRQGADGIGLAIMNNSRFKEARDEFLGFYNNTTEGFRNSVLCGLMARLNLWVNPRVVALTETTDIDFEALAEQLFTFYFAVPAKQDHLKPLAALIFNFLLQSALDKNFKKPLALFLDEFLNYGYIPGMPEALTIIRHKHIPITLGIQDLVQLRKVYGDDNAVLLFGQPGTKICFKPRELGTAKKIAETLGTKTVVERKVNSSGHILEREFGRPLLNPSELMSLEKNQAIVVTPSTSPIKMSIFRWQDYAIPTAYPPPEFRLLDVDEELERTCNETAAKPDWQKVWEAKKKKAKDSDVENMPERNEPPRAAAAPAPPPPRKGEEVDDGEDSDQTDSEVPPY